MFLSVVYVFFFILVGFFFFFKQKTAYEMRISDWSSDVCSSDLQGLAAQGLSADRGRCAGTEPQPGKLLRGSRTGGVLASQRRARHWLFAGPHAAGANLCVSRRASVPGRHQLPASAGESTTVPVSQLSTRRCDAFRRQWWRCAGL